MPADSAAVDAGSPADASPVAGRNGRGMVRLLTLDRLDGRTMAARRAKELVAGLESDLGGPDHLSVAERQLVQRAAVLGAIIEHTEACWLAGEPVDVQEHLAAINAQRRVLATVGLERLEARLQHDNIQRAVAGAREELAKKLDRFLSEENIEEISDREQVEGSEAPESEIPD